MTPDLPHASPPHASHAPAWPAVPYRAPPASSLPVPHARHPSRPLRPIELGALAALVVLTDVAAFAGDHLAAGGLGLSLFFAACPAIAIVATRHRRASARLAYVSALLLATCVRAAWAPTSGTLLAGLGLLLAFVVTLRRTRVHVPEILVTGLHTTVALPARVASVTRGLGRVARGARLGRASLLPVVVPAALCAAFAIVFGLANPVVARALSAVFHALGRLVAFPSPGRVVTWALALAAGAALLRPAIARARLSEEAPRADGAKETELAVAKNALVALNALFLGYHALDATYLWAGSPPPGTTTQAYAHQGAFWLTIALAMLTAVVGGLFRGALAHDARARVVRALGYAWSAQGLVLALGTYRRIAMHIAKSGLSDLRIVGVLGTTLVATGLVLVVLKLRRERSFAWLVRRQLDAFAITAVVYALFPTHLVSARVNVARIAAGEYRPVLHMFRQSKEVESAAELLPLLDHPDKRVRQGVAALLAEETERLAREASAARSWRAEDIATGLTLARLESARPRLDALTRNVDGQSARHVLLQISRVANEDRSLEELYAIPAADADDLGTRTRYAQ